MKASKLIPLLLILILITSCGYKDNKVILPTGRQVAEDAPLNIPIDKGFSEYISGYTSGIIPANSAIEIRFTPEFAAKADKAASGLFVFDPALNPS